MLSRNTRLLLVGLLALLFAAPALGMPGGPPWKNGDSLVVESGCSCHGDGVPSTEVVVSISGVPRSYTLDETYTFTVTLQHASNAEGGFMIWDYNMGTLTPGEGSAVVPDEPGAIAQSAVGNNWVFTWTAPSEDIGVVPFQLVGNAVNGNGNFDAGDAWNILSFSISEPGSTTNEGAEEEAVRTISVGDYDSLFVADVDPEVAEAERQAQIADHILRRREHLLLCHLLYLSSLQPSSKASSTSASLVEAMSTSTRASPSRKASAEVP